MQAVAKDSNPQRDSFDNISGQRIRFPLPGGDAEPERAVQRVKAIAAKDGLYRGNGAYAAWPFAGGDPQLAGIHQGS